MVEVVKSDLHRVTCHVAANDQLEMVSWLLTVNNQTVFSRQSPAGLGVLDEMAAAQAPCEEALVTEDNIWTADPPDCMSKASDLLVLVFFVVNTCACPAYCHKNTF